MTLNVRHPPPVTCPRCPFFGGVPILVVMEGSHSRSRGVTETLAAAATHAPSDVDAAVAELEDVTLVPPHEGAEVAVRRAALRAAIAELSGRQRELVALKFFAGLTN